MFEVVAWSFAIIMAVLALTGAVYSLGQNWTIWRMVVLTGQAVSRLDVLMINIFTWTTWTRAETPFLRLTGLVFALSAVTIAAAIVHAPYHWIALGFGLIQTVAVFRQWMRDEAERDAGVFGSELTYCRRGDLVREGLIASLFAVALSGVAMARLKGEVLDFDTIAFWPPPDVIIAIGREILAALPIINLWPFPSDGAEIKLDVPDYVVFLNRLLINLMFMSAIFRFIAIRNRAGLLDDLRDADNTLQGGELVAARAVLRKLFKKASSEGHQGSINRIRVLAEGKNALDTAFDMPEDKLKLQFSAIGHATKLALQTRDHSLSDLVSTEYQNLAAVLRTNANAQSLYRDVLKELADFLLATRTLHGGKGTQQSKARAELVVLTSLLTHLTANGSSSKAMIRVQTRAALTSLWLIQNDAGANETQTRRTMLQQLRQALQTWVKTTENQSLSESTKQQRELTIAALKRIQDAKL